MNTVADSIIAVLFVFTLAIGLWEWLNAPSKAEPEHSVQVSFSDVLLELDPLPSGAAVKKTAVSVSRDAAESARRKSSSTWRINFETPAIGNPGSASAEPPRPASAEAPRYYFSPSSAMSPPQPSPPSKWAVNEPPAPRAMAAAPSAPDLNPAPQPAGSSTLMQRPEHWSGAGLQLVDRVLPHYPRLAASERLQGEVVLLATIGRDGTVADVRPVSGPPVLAASAVDAVRQWHFRPYEVDGRAVQVQTNIRVNFALPK